MANSRLKVFLKPFNHFLHSESTAGILLLFSALLAIGLANSPLSEWYFHLWENHLAVRLGNLEIDKDLHHWINDGMMAMFFFVIGLELKREIMAGELRSFKKALLPIVAAIGGMVVPALVFLLFNPTGEAQQGWGVPMATDIAFALGILALLGKRVPLSLKVFLTALAIADDLGAVLVIAFFYTSDIYFANLGFGLVLMFVLLAGNLLGVRKTLFYGLIGIGGVWLAFLTSGVHATIAGVLAAMAIPARTKIDEVKFIDQLEIAMKRFKEIPPNDVTLLEPKQHEVVERISLLTLQAATPLQRLERNLHPWVSFVVMPLFAFANAGMRFSPELFSATFFAGVSMGVFAGLLIGKFIGVMGMVWIMKKTGLADLPTGVTWRHMTGTALLAGIGFTMSLFISTLAFEDPDLILEAKAGIFSASLVCGVAGYFVLAGAKRNDRAE